MTKVKRSERFIIIEVKMEKHDILKKKKKKLQ